MKTKMKIFVFYRHRESDPDEIVRVEAPSVADANNLYALDRFNSIEGKRLVQWSEKQVFKREWKGSVSLNDGHNIEKIEYIIYDMTEPDKCSLYKIFVNGKNVANSVLPRSRGGKTKTEQILRSYGRTDGTEVLDAGSLYQTWYVSLPAEVYRQIHDDLFLPGEFEI